MKIRHIEVFQAVYSSGSMTQAAKLLHVTQPSVSKVLAHAESQLGYKLFKRASGRVVPTHEANILFEHTNRLFNELQKVKNIAINLRSLSEGKIRIASTPALGLDLVPAAVATCMQRNPKAYFYLETMHYADMAMALRNLRIDIAIAFDPPYQPGLHEHIIGKGCFVLIAPVATRLRRTSVTIEDVAHLPFIRLSERGPLGQLLEGYFKLTDAKLTEVAAAETYHIARSLVANGIGVAIVDDITAYTGNQEGIKIYAFKPQLTYRVSALYLQNYPLNEFAQSFIHALRKKIKQLNL